MGDTLSDDSRGRLDPSREGAIVVKVNVLGDGEKGIAALLEGEVRVGGRDLGEEMLKWEKG